MVAKVGEFKEMVAISFSKLISWYLTNNHPIKNPTHSTKTQKTNKNHHLRNPVQSSASAGAIIPFQKVESHHP